MLTCMPRSKQPNATTGHDGDLSPDDQQIKFSDRIPPIHPNTKLQHSSRTITSQIKDMALKASGAYRNCTPCTGPVTQAQRQKSYSDSDSGSDKFRWSYRRTGSSNSSAGSGKVWGKEMEARLKGISSGEATPASTLFSASGRRVEPVVLVEENEPKEWVAQVEPGVLITFVSLPRGGNHLKRIRFSREIFNKWQAQKWWAENYDKVMELYNVQRLNKQAFPLPTPPRSEDDHNLKIDSVQGSPVTPPLNKERLPRTLYRPMGMGYSSSDSFEHHPMHSRHNNDSCGLTATPKLSSISGTKTETSSMDASIRTSSSRDADCSGDLSISNASDLETEWVEQDEPGVYITIRALAGGARELRRVRFSREKFGEMHARLWWEENRSRIHKQYL
ncbi:protein Brevis radix-like 4 [Apium graveolens]|uniref:protein Brevis radix-like 4 n=1 Tax=Apium graveolens TaxID=4045 RepID=UPI003D7ADEA9